MRLVPLDEAFLLEQRLEHRIDRVRGPERLLEPRPALPGSDHGELAGTDVGEAATVEHEWDARREERLADDESATPPDLDDDALRQRDLDPQEAAQRQSRSGGAEQEPEPEQDQRVRPEGERLDARPTVEPRDDRRQRDLLAQEE